MWSSAQSAPLTTQRWGLFEETVLSCFIKFQCCRDLQQQMYVLISLQQTTVSLMWLRPATEVFPSQAGAYTEPVQSSTATVKAHLQIPNEFYTCKGEKKLFSFFSFPLFKEVFHWHRFNSLKHLKGFCGQ